MDKYFKHLDDKFKDTNHIAALNNINLNNLNLEELYNLTLKLSDEIESQKIDFYKDKKSIVNKHKEKLNYLAQICKDTKQPILKTFNMLELLKGTKLDDMQIKYINILQTSLEEIESNLEKTTDYTKVETGNFMPAFVDFNLSYLIKETYDYYKLKALTKDVKVNLINEVKNFGSYKSDPYRINQVLYGILDNAINFTDSGKIDFIIEESQHFGTMAEIKFIIRDTGTGLKMDKMSKLFQQVKMKYATSLVNSEKEMEKSNFNIITKIAQYMGGDLKIESSGYQGGVQFVFSIPLEVSQ
jgi:two-component system, sensor histidine kinase